MRVLGMTGIVIACIGGWMANEALAQRGAASKALGNHYDFYASDGSWQYSGPAGTFRPSTSGMGLITSYNDQGVFHLAGHGRGGCGCGRGYRSYRPRTYGYRYYDDGMYGYYGDYYDGDMYGYDRRAYPDYGDGHYSQQYGYRPEPRRGDDVIVVSPGAELMRGYDVVGVAEQGQRLPVLQIAGPWVGTMIERNGQRIGGWILRDSLVVASDAMREQRPPLERERGYGPRPVEPQQPRDLEPQPRDLEPEFPPDQPRDTGQEPPRRAEDQPRESGPY